MDLTMSSGRVEDCRTALMRALVNDDGGRSCVALTPSLRTRARAIPSLPLKLLEAPWKSMRKVIAAVPTIPQFYREPPMNAKWLRSAFRKRGGKRSFARSVRDRKPAVALADSGFVGVRTKE